MKVIARRDDSLLAAIRVIFRTGSACDPPGKWGAAWLTARMLAHGGSRRRSYKQIVDVLFPLGTAVACHVDKQMMCFRLETHRDNLERASGLLCEMLLDPGWRGEDFERLRDDAVNYLEAELRGGNDEELARQALYGRIFAGHPYGRHCAGSVSSLRRLDLSDLVEFYAAEFSRENLTLAAGGGMPSGLGEQLRRRFESLPLRSRSGGEAPPAGVPEENAMLFIEKPSRGVAISAGFPIEVRRGHPDYPALLVAVSALGQHRNSSGRLFASMRQQRGLNYGDYAYIEYFPSPMFTLEPEPNHARERQIFELWIRPVEPAQAHFALRLAIYELERFVSQGLEAEEFERARRFVSKYVNLLPATRSAEIGYAADSDFYRIGPYPEYVRDALRELTVGEVNCAIRKHLRWDRMHFAFAGEGMAALRQAILDNACSPAAYNSPKAAPLTGEDEEVARRKIELRPESALVAPAEAMFE